MIYFAIEEEYGYRDWIWAFPGPPAEALAEWKAGRRPVGALVDGPIKGTIHQVNYIFPWSRKSALSFPAFHCDGKSRDDFCDECDKVTVIEYVPVPAPAGAASAFFMAEKPFPAITSRRQFAGEGHAHEEDDTYLDVKGVGHFHDRHAKCPVGCESCWTCQAHTRSMSDKDYKCAVCAQPLCTVCSGCAETAFCTEHSVVDAIGLLEDS